MIRYSNNTAECAATNGQPIRKARVERFLQLMFDPAIKAAMLQEVQHDIAAMVRSMAVLSAAVSMALRSVSDEQQ